MILQTGDSLITELSIDEVVVLYYPPTAEILAALICGWLVDLFDCKSYRVRFWETDNCFVECTDLDYRYTTEEILEEKEVLVESLR